ncbi:MAG: lipopolysaccharide heptosyltransferase II, partial [Nitrospiraceae bacterium]|nr:lipopolysaccharide heptosyltransferase II [Nitrospiraceae bacterium]
SVVAQWCLISDLRRLRCDSVIDLTDGDRSAWLSWLSGAPIRIGFNEEQRWRGGLYSHVVQSTARHRVDRDLEALIPFGIVASDRTPRLSLTFDDERQAGQLLERLGLRPTESFAVIQPGARYWFKAWPAERFAALADRLAGIFGYRVLIGGSEQDRQVAEQIASLATSKLAMLAGQASLRTFAAVVKKAALFVGNDSGAMHIAAAVGTPIVALFGPSNPAEWGPRGLRVEVIYKGVDCRVCFHPTCERGEQNCMKQIAVDEVMMAVRRVVATTENL